MPTPIDALEKIYQSFEQETAPFRQAAACAEGCAYCCTDAGRIDCTTLEALRIRDHMAKMARPRRRDLQKRLKRDMRRREGGIPSACPFLAKTRVCTIYPLRPFACRRIYSLQRCSPEQAPMLSRQVMAVAGAAIAALQRLDANGYSGHLSFMLHLLDQPGFRATYRAGAFKPEAIMAFGKSHGIVINKMVA